MADEDLRGGVEAVEADDVEGDRRSDPPQFLRLRREQLPSLPPPPHRRVICLPDLCIRAAPEERPALRVLLRTHTRSLIQWSWRPREGGAAVSVYRSTNALVVTREPFESDAFFFR